MIDQNKLYNKKSNCCGCELCAMVCNHGVIEMRPDKSGFLYPEVVNQTACVSCNLCLNICPEKVSYKPYQTIKAGYGGFYKDDEEIKKSASGGLSYALARRFINDHGVVYGVKYSEDCYFASFGRTESISDLAAFRTSKYIQSKKSNIYASVKDDLKNNRKVLFVGLPCEVAALYNYLRKEYNNLYTISLLCHGTTSPSVQKQFCTQLEKEAGDKIVSFSVRHKINGWKPYYIKAVYQNGSEFIKPFVETEYETAFKYLKRPSCTSCIFKLKNQQFGFKADMIIGDYHGAKTNQPFYNKWGASKFYTLTDKGEMMRQWASEYMEISSISIVSIHNGSPVINIPTRKLLFCDTYRDSFEKKGLQDASRNRLVRFSARYFQPLSKQFHSALQRLQVKLFKRIIKW